MHTVLDNREWGNDFFRSLESSWNRPVLSHDSLRHNRFRVSAYKLVAASAKEARGGKKEKKGRGSINRDDPRGGQLRPRRKEGCRTISP